MAFILKLLCRIRALLHPIKYKYSQESEGNFAYMKFSEKLWWGYKYFFKQIERAEKGKHIEEYFENQDLIYSLPENFMEESSLTLAAGGDILASHHIRPDNTQHVFDELDDFFFGADIACANLETPVVPEAAASFVPKNILTAPPLNNTPEIFDVFYQGGKRINFFSTANNHCLDLGEDGLRSTLNFLDSRGCPHVGTSRTEAEREDIPVICKNGIKVAFLSYTFSQNGKAAPEGKEYLTNYIRLNRPDCDISMIERHIRIAKVEKQADIVVACLHWSIEFESYPIQNVIDMGHRLMDRGIDIIIGNHPHVIQPMEKYRFTDPFTKMEKAGFIVYALGDLISCHDHIYNSRLNNLVRLEIVKGTTEGTETTIISDLKIRPMFIYSKMEGGKCTDFRLLDSRKLMSELNAGENRLVLDADAIRELGRLENLRNRVLPKEVMA